MGFNAAKSERKRPKNRIQQLAREVMSEISELDPSHSTELMGTFVSELFLLVAEQRQREDRREKQAKGIAAAKAKGVRFGPKPRAMPDDFEELRRAWRNREMSLAAAAELCGVPKTTFYDAALRAEMAANHTEAK